jgi:hypothetical protein
MVVNNGSDRVRLCGEALVRLNGESIASFSDGSRAATICGMCYERVYRKALVANRWSFTRTYKALAPLSDAPTAHLPWRYRFPLPSDCINLIGVIFPPDGSDGGDPIAIAYAMVPNNQYGRLDSYGTDYELRDGCLCANRRKLVIDYQYAVPESMLENYPLFREYLVLLLASEFAVSVMNDDTKLQRFTALAQDAYGLAASTDSASNPVPLTNYSTVVTRMRTFG